VGKDRPGRDDPQRGILNTERRGAFFGRRKGHRLRPRQAQLLDTLLPQLALDLSNPAPADLRTLFPRPVDDVHLEIGFGAGEYLIARAQENPSIGFVGCEPFVNAMAKMLTVVEAAGLTNIRLHFDDAAYLLDWLPSAGLGRLDLIFPDPWPKRRHWKRRFVQDASVAAMARILRPGGELRFATDVPDYATWTLQRLLRSSAFSWTAERADDWRRPWSGFARTRYEAKAMREGRVPAYFIFRRR
jgi:tRNA (guanine-N7-)-methyltransferase